MNYVLKAILLSFVALMVGACGKGNSKVPIIDPATGKHVAGWAVATTGGSHPAFFLADFKVCYECHGTDLKGGISNVSCFSASRSGITCHPNGPPPPHVVKYPNHGADVVSKTSGFCLSCHQDAANTAGSKPPGCQNCHLTSPVTTPNGCASCHAKPPNRAVYPNISGMHAPHASLNVVQNATLTGVCNECHNGLGLGTVDHLDRSRARTASPQPNPVAFGTLASTGGLVPTYTAATKTCDNTYCHGNNLDKTGGEILSPKWGVRFLTGVATSDCTKCHGYPPLTLFHGGAGVPNSPVNGCKTCHPHVNAAGTGFDDPSKHVDGIKQHTP